VSLSAPAQGPRDPAFYRANVGLIVFNRDGLVFLGRRANSDGPWQWQFPQGGIDVGEEPMEAAWRELAEETGLSQKSARLLRGHEPWLYYDFPPDILANGRGRFMGQRQKWFAFELTQPESAINLSAHKPIEFDAWKWVPLNDTPALTIPWKRPVYLAIADAFSDLAKPEAAA
jgi:putative (di)nucleoside polyphosphate hydrolase